MTVVSSEIVCTLFERDYSIGAAALINSLHRSGFHGTVICGVRGALPQWARDLDGILPTRVRFVVVQTSHHLTYYKPAFMLECLSSAQSIESGIVYLDPDIVVKAPWSRIARWYKDGVALVEDVNGTIPQGHPARLIWRDFLASQSVHVERTLGTYYNAGFIGVPASATSLLSAWDRVIGLSSTLMSDDLTQMKNHRADGLFRHADQDALNMALELGTWPINAGGPSEMDFTPGGELLSHAIGTPKPWHGNHLRRALLGRPPSLADWAYLRHADGPLRALTSAKLRSRRSEARVAALLGRFYRRA